LKISDSKRLGIFFASVFIVVLLIVAGGVALAAPRKSPSLVVVAAGEITWNGLTSTGYNVASVNWDAINKNYQISFSGIDYDFQNYITVVTANGAACIAWTDSAGGMLIVGLEQNGVPVQGTFSFVTYQVR